MVGLRSGATTNPNPKGSKPNTNVEISDGTTNTTPLARSNGSADVTPPSITPSVTVTTPVSTPTTPVVTPVTRGTGTGSTNNPPVNTPATRSPGTSSVNNPLVITHVNIKSTDAANNPLFGRNPEEVRNNLLP
ncbi:leucine-rich repeat extensin-like protein 5 [Papaver somniferum]|uniref:leucine-rich repeat extensin-like protein 5 n=1 Tax=Papaver somniferum TaxID=3469 RepID=UPI000E7047A2|nr:leucine-rich repeat extensin-like protein 5 [Papaver somniferum]